MYAQNFLKVKPRGLISQMAPKSTFTNWSLNLRGLPFQNRLYLWYAKYPYYHVDKTIFQNCDRVSSYVIRSNTARPRMKFKLAILKLIISSRCVVSYQINLWLRIIVMGRTYSNVIFRTLNKFEYIHLLVIELVHPISDFKWKDIWK